MAKESTNSKTSTDGGGEGLAHGTNGIRRSISDYMHKDLIKYTESDAIETKIPYGQANVLSKASFWWMWAIMLRLHKQGLPSLLSLSWHAQDAAAAQVEKLEKCWNEELQTQGPCKASLKRALINAYKRPLVQTVIVIIITLSFSFIGSACILRFLLQHISSDTPNSTTGLIIVFSLIACEFCRSFTFSLAWSYNYFNGTRGRASAMGLLYKKILKLRSLKDWNIGELVNMFSHDGQRVFEAMANGPFIIGGPLIFLVGSVYLCVLMGFWGLVAIATYIAVFIIIKFLNDGIEHFREKAVDLTGKRVGLMTEVLTCMKLIKMNGWQSSFIKRIIGCRQKEQYALERASFLKSVVTSLVPMIPVIASAFLFLGYVMSGNNLTAAEAFTIISVFYAMSFSLACALYGVQTLIDVRVAVSRYKDILLMEEQTVYPAVQDKGMAVEINMASLTWESDEFYDCETREEDSLIGGLNVEDVKELPNLHRQSILKEPVDNQPDVIENASAASALLQRSPSKKSKRDSNASSVVLALKEVDINIKKGELIGICGMKSSGKSSLLSAILGRMQMTEGDIRVTGSVAFLSQDPWLMNGTAKDNILFGRPFDKLRYDRIINATRLDKDFETFSARDEVEVGDRGLTLSGGQKQRICLARAIYSNSDVYLLDDPLSAVDVNVGRHIFAQCIKTILHSKTVFMVTHHLEYLPKCDKVLYMHDGYVVAFGSHDELMGSNTQYSELYTLYNSKYDRILKDRMQGAKKQRESVSILQRGFSKANKKEISRQLSRMSMKTGVQHQYSVLSGASTAAEEYESLNLEDLVNSRDQPDCRVRSSTYLSYIRHMGGWAVLMALLVSFMVSIAIQSVTTGFVAFWLNQGDGRGKQNPNDTVFINGNDPNTSYIPYGNITNKTSSVVSVVLSTLAGNLTTTNNTTPSSLFSSSSSSPSSSSFTSSPEEDHHHYHLGRVVDNPHLHTYAFVYAMFLLAMLIILVARSALFIKLLLRASGSLHKHLLKSTIASPMNFFDSTPIGIILNRFSADIDEIDVRLATNCELFLQNVFLVLSALFLISLQFPWDMVVILPLVFVFCLLVHLFAPTLQQLKFVDNVTRAPYLSHLGASVEGIATISSFHQGDHFYQKFCDLVNKNNIPFFLFYAANRWLAVFLDSMTVVVTGVTGFLIIFTLTPENSSQAGLALSFAIQISSLVQYTLRLSMETVSRFSSVQRIQDYVETLEEEGSSINKDRDDETPAEWPNDGGVSFKQYKMRYNHGLPLVLNGININISPKEKIGIVGNSGCGKSSLGVGLFRLAEAASGTIIIDGFNIRDIPLDILRSRLSILVQDPVLFTGTVRYNLDPSEAITNDGDFWSALEKCRMKAKIQSLDKGLDTQVEEYGRNFSMGEKQLLCLARTLLRNTKILVLDEATASVDSSTELLVQQTIRDVFQHCTVFMIAHRINTVWDCDKILVMEKGKVVEFNTPSNLLQKSQSRFKFMFDLMKSQPRGASINDEQPNPVSVSISPHTPHGKERNSHSSNILASTLTPLPLRNPTTPRFSTSPSHLHSPILHSPSPSPGADFSPLRDSVIFDDAMAEELEEGYRETEEEDEDEEEEKERKEQKQQ